jgi:hypothetical protein
MKHLIFVFSLFVFCFSRSNAQLKNDGGCSTRISVEQEAWLKKWVSEHGDTYRNVKSGIVYMPIKAHVVGRDNGTGYYSLATLLQVICELNVRYQPVGFYFYLDPSIDYINNTNFYQDGSSQDAYSSMGASNVADEINMYFVQASPGLCGYYAPWLDCVCIIGGCGQPGGTTITHELGHFFSLPHTFNGWEGGNTPGPGQLELVNGSNCSTAGDFFCDTPADFLSGRWNCPYMGTMTDPTGTPYNPDPTFYMSYASDVCTNRFSNLQIGAMQANALSRTTLINQGIPNMTAVTQVPNNCSPTNFDFNLLPNYTMLRWTKPANADYCLVQLAAFGGGAILKEVITSDTFLALSNLNANSPFQWRVRGFNAGNTCDNATLFSAWNTFSTGDQNTAITNLVSITTLYAFQKENGEWNISNGAVEKVNIDIYNSLGVKVCSKSLSSGINELVELQEMPAGAYFIVASQYAKRLTELKIIK